VALTCALRAPRKKVQGLTEVADSEVSLARAVLGLALELSIAGLGRDRQGTLSDLDGLKMLAGDVPEPRADIGEDPPQASRIAEPGRQALSFAHDRKNILVLPEWYECEPQLESYIDGLREGVRGLGQPLECPQRLPEQPGSRAIRGPGHRPSGRLPKVFGRFVPGLGTNRVAGKTLDLLTRLVGVSPL
jgi:hypothetical protein